MLFGDIVINEWASADNPNKVLMVISYRTIVICLNIKGQRVQFRNDKNLRLTKIGEVDLTGWESYVDRELAKGE